MTPRTILLAMPPITPRPSRVARARQAEQPKVSIEDRLLTAMETLLERGQRFGTLSVEQLSSVAGISRGTFYLHFQDKGELVARLMSHIAQELIDSGGTWFGNAAAASADDLREALVGMVHTFKKHQAILSAVADLAPSDEKVGAIYRDLIERLCAQSRRSLAAVRRKGLSRPGATDHMADTMCTMIVDHCIRAVGSLDAKGLDRLARSLGYLGVNAVFADPA